MNPDTETEFKVSLKEGKNQIRPLPKYLSKFFSFLPKINKHYSRQRQFYQFRKTNFSTTQYQQKAAYLALEFGSSFFVTGFGSGTVSNEFESVKVSTSSSVVTLPGNRLQFEVLNPPRARAECWASTLRSRTPRCGSNTTKNSFSLRTRLALSSHTAALSFKTVLYCCMLIPPYCRDVTGLISQCYQLRARFFGPSSLKQFCHRGVKFQLVSSFYKSKALLLII